MNGINMNGNGGSAMSNGNGGSAPATTGGCLGGMDMSTISALVVLASAFMRR